MPLSFLMPGGAKIGGFYVGFSGRHDSDEERLARSEHKKRTPSGVLVIFGIAYSSDVAINLKTGSWSGAIPISCGNIVILAVLAFTISIYLPGMMAW